MSYDLPVELIENDVLVVSVLGADDKYFMWQKELTENAGSVDGVYFEYDDQVNGGHNQVLECTISSDGVCVTLTNGKLEYLKFPANFDKFKEFHAGLNKIYAGQENIVKSCI